MTSTGADEGTCPARIGLLGPFRLEVDGALVDVPTTAQRVLARLALVGSWENRHMTAERLWPQHDGDRRRASLRTALWRLRRSCDRPIVETAGQLLRLCPDVLTDLANARRLARQVLDGELPDVPIILLAELTSDVLPEWDDDWVILERQHFRDMRLHALEALSASLRLRGAYVGALEAARSAVAAEPLRESAHRRAIEAYLAQGNVADANRQFHHYRQVLSEELGLEPSPAIASLVFPVPVA